MPTDTANPALLGPPDQLSHDDFEFVVRRLADDLTLGADLSIFVGGGLEYASSRPYQPGDPVRLLNWRLLAQTGKPFIKEHEALRRICTHLLPDTSASMTATSTPLSKRSLAVWTAAALALVAQRRMSPAAVHSDSLAGLFPTLSRTDLWRQVEPLRAASIAPRSAASRLRDVIRRAPRAGLIVVISDFCDPDLTAALLEAAQRHDCMAIRPVDPAEVCVPDVGFYRGGEAGSGRVFMGHSRARWPDADEQERRLSSAGIDCLRLPTDRPFVAELRRFITARASSRRAAR